MANEELIDSYVDRQAVADDTKFLKEELKSVLSSFEKVKGVKINLRGAVSLKDITAGTKAAQTAMDGLNKSTDQLIDKLVRVQKLEADSQKQSNRSKSAPGSLSGNVSLSKSDGSGFSRAPLSQPIADDATAAKIAIASEKELTRLQDEHITVLTKMTAAETDLGKAVAKTKEEQRRATMELKARIREESSAEGSINQLRALLKLLELQYDDLSESERNAEAGQGMKNEIRSISDELKKLEGETGRFQRNVGNYANAFSDALGGLDDHLKNIRTQLADKTLSPDMLAKFTQQEMALDQVLKSLNQNFASTKQQSRAFKEAVAQIGIAFGHTSQVFEDFKSKVGEGVDSLNDISDSIKLAASDTRQLDRLIGAATALAGGFSIVNGVIALTGKESEELNKTLVKLQAVQAVLNGLQAIQAELTNKDSLLRKISSFFIKEQTTSIQAQTVATEVNTAATNTATKAVKGFGVALKSIGIGILLILLPLITSAMSSVSKATKKVDEDLKDMGETTDEIAATAIKNLDENIKSLNDSLGNTTSDIDKARKALKLLGDDLNKKGFWESAAFSLRAAFQGSSGVLTEESEKYKQYQELQKKITEASYLQRLQAQQLFLNGSLEAQTNAQQNSISLLTDENNRSLNVIKKQYDDRLITQAQYYQQSSALLKKNLEAERQAIQTSLNQDLSNAGNDPNKRKIAQDNANKAGILAERNYQTALQELSRQTSDDARVNARKDLQAELDILKAKLEGQIDYYKQVSDIDAVNVNTRTDARQKAFDLEKQIIEAERDFQLSAEKLTAKEKEKINFLANDNIRKAQDKLTTDLLSIQASYRVKLKEQMDEDRRLTEEGLKEQEQSRVNAAQAVHDRTVALAAENQATEQKILDAWYLKRLAATRVNSRAREKVEEQYALRRAEIESDAAINVTKAQIDLVKRLLAIKKASNEDTSNEARELAELEMALSDIVTKRKIANDEKERRSNREKLEDFAAGAEQIKSIFDQATGLAGDLMSAFNDRQKQQIQDEIDELEKRKEKELANIDATIAGEKEKDEAKKAIELKAQARKEQLEARQRQLDIQRARFERFRAVADIILNTAVGITKALSTLNIPLSIAIGAMGAAQLVTALAAPLPKFKHGLKDSPGLFGITGDGGRHEVMASPDMSQAVLTPDKDTVTYIPKGWNVFPSVEDFRENAVAMGKPVVVPSTDRSLFDEGILMSALDKSNGKFFRSLENTIKNKQENHTYLKNGEFKRAIKKGSNWDFYINKNIG